MSLFQDSDLSWAMEYIHGIKHEIYAVTFSEAFIGLTFLQCSEIIYKNFGAALFSIGIYRMTKGCFIDSQLGSNTSPFQIFLNPQDYKIQGNEIGFVICDNAEITAKMASYKQPPKNWFSVASLAKSAQNMFFKGKDRSRSINNSEDIITPLYTQVDVDSGPELPLVPLCNTKSN